MRDGPVHVPSLDLPELTNAEISRYSRHLLLDGIGMEGQRRLKASRVLCVGAGGLGSPLLMYLAAAGVGHIGVVDHDVVDASNLQRQILHGTGTLGWPKGRSARRRLLDLNPAIQVEVHEGAVTRDNVLEILGPYDVIVDGTDNFPTRYLVNDACVLLGKPYVYGSIFKFEGQASVFNHQGGPNYRDLYPEPPPPGLVPSCAEGGVLGVLPGIIGTIQATETLKILLGLGETLSGRLLLYDALTMRFRELALRRDPAAPPITGLPDVAGYCGGPGAGREGGGGEAFRRLSVQEARARFDAGWDPFVLDVRRPREAEIVALDRTDLVHPHAGIAAVADRLPRDRDLLVLCKVGGRSVAAIETLLSLGFDGERLFHLDGGILAWVREIDPRLPTY